MRPLLLLALLAPALAACDAAAPAGAVEVASYDGPALTEADVSGRPWTALSIADGVRLSQSTPCGTGCAETVRLTLSDRGGNNLPRFVDAEVVTKTSAGTASTDLPIDRVEVQDWGPEVISGIAYPADENRAPIVFWAPVDYRTDAP